VHEPGIVERVQPFDAPLDLRFTADEVRGQQPGHQAQAGHGP
jgi:hypothetical protein